MRATAATGTSAAATTRSRRPTERRLVERNGQRVLVESRAGDEGIRTLIVPLANSAPLQGAFVEEVVASVPAAGGPVRVRSTAMTEAEASGFLDAGFDVQRRLHLLVLDVHDRPSRRSARPGLRLVRAPRRHDESLLAVDHATFEEDLRLDELDLAGALRATPVVRVRLARLDGAAVGYAIFGRAGRRGYLQRLAVRPELRRQGIARALVVDGVRWCAQRRVDRIVVNTEHGNEGALTLYRSLGFVDTPIGLVIMERSVSSIGRP